jgi:SAM-dependent methyltransferase
MAASPDWSLGRYEHTAAQLLDAARAVVDRADPAPGEAVLDVGCGTGNAALLAAERGARVTGVDPAARLLEVARKQAAARGLDAAFVAGEAAALPVADGAVDVVLSVFGVIFATDAEAAAREIARVTAPGGRVALSAWIPDAAMTRAVRVVREAIARALGTPFGPPPFAWHEAGALGGLFAPYGFDVTVDEHTLAFPGPSPEAFLDAELANHPLWLAGRSVLEPRGELEAVRGQALAVLRDANEDPAAFRVTSRYVVASGARRTASRRPR